jgi:outer membrane lipoprotein-sorting protein
LVRRILAFLLFTGLCLGPFTRPSGGTVPVRKDGPLTCRQIIDQMLLSIENVKTLKYHLNITERIKGNLKHTESIVKLNRNPRKIYMNLKGPEVLWIQGANNGNALVNPNGFPYIDLNLDPMGSILRENQHHTIHEIGFDYYASILRSSVKFAGAKFDSYFKFKGELEWNKRICYSIVAEYPEFKFVDYTVKKGEDLVKIARALFVSEYMVLEANAATVSDFYDVSEGQVIKVPILYGKKTELLIDKEYLLPVSTKVYDDKGIYEGYEYDILLVNPPIKDEEFTKTYKDYHF